MPAPYVYESQCGCVVEVYKNGSDMQSVLRRVCLKHRSTMTVEERIVTSISVEIKSLWRVCLKAIRKAESA